jgi:transcriptional repressor NrdR
MRCPYCDAFDSFVISTRSFESGGEIRRRRECRACGERFTTVERVRASLPLVVKSSGDGGAGRRERFDRDKLRESIQLACHKRPISSSAIERLVGSIQAQVEGQGSGEVPSQAIGEMVIDGLRGLDEVAYIRYAIVFLGLEDLLAVRDEIDRLLKDRTHSPVTAGDRADHLSNVS